MILLAITNKVTIDLKNVKKKKYWNTLSLKLFEDFSSASKFYLRLQRKRTLASAKQASQICLP